MPKDDRLIVRVPREDVAVLRVAAARTGTTVSALVRRAAMQAAVDAISQPVTAGDADRAR